MKNFTKVLLISFLIPNHLIASEFINKKHFYLEIKSLKMVMNYKKFKNPFMYKNNDYKYHAIPIDECNCLVKVRKNNRLELFNIDICNKILFKN